MSGLPGLYNDFVAIFLMMAGFYVVIAQGNLVKKLVGLGLFQTSVFIFYISMGKVAGGHAPILTEGVTLYSNPLPHVLILTAIVVGVATTAVGLALVVRINEAYGSVEEEEIQAKDRAAERQLAADDEATDRGA
ncbi:MAG: cation:proton antiporter subunit C, partial [Thiohalocapsa sp.]